MVGWLVNHQHQQQVEIGALQTSGADVLLRRGTKAGLCPWDLEGPWLMVSVI